MNSIFAHENTKHQFRIVIKHNENVNFIFLWIFLIWRLHRSSLMESFDLRNHYASTIRQGNHKVQIFLSHRVKRVHQIIAKHQYCMNTRDQIKIRSLRISSRWCRFTVDLFFWSCGNQFVSCRAGNSKLRIFASFVGFSTAWQISASEQKRPNSLTCSVWNSFDVLFSELCVVEQIADYADVKHSYFHTLKNIRADTHIHKHAVRTSSSVIFDVVWGAFDVIVS